MLNIQEKMAEEVKVLSLSGKFDFSDLKAFRTALKKTEDEPLINLIIDFSNVSSIDSTALGVLVAGQKRLSKNNIAIILVINPESAVGRAMNHVAIQKLMPTFHSEEDAISSLVSSATSP